MPDAPINNQKPPSGDFQKAEKYIQKLIELIDQDKITAVHTDLAQFDLNNMQDHYWVDLQEYRVEISHSKAPNSGEDAYIMIFTNLQKIRSEVESGNQEECTNKIILAFSKLNSDQFDRFKSASYRQIEKIKKREEEKRFQEALKPIDNLLDSIASDIKTVGEEAKKNNAKTLSEYNINPDYPILDQS